MSEDARIILAGISIVVVLVCFVFMISPNPADYTTNVTITVAEKYPLHTYDGWCGKFPCTKTENAKIVDTNGELWNFLDESAWAKIRINETYVMKIGTLPSDFRKVYSVTKIE